MARNTEQLIVVGLGGNLAGPAGSPVNQIRTALATLDKQHGLRVVEISDFYASPAWPVTEPPKPDYVNAAALVTTALSLPDTMDVLLRVEEDYGRVRDGLWSSRSLDLDILAAEKSVYPAIAAWRTAFIRWQSSGIREDIDSLFVPHLRLTERAFALKPLLDVAPDWQHSIFSKGYSALFEDLSETDKRALRLLPCRDTPL